MDFRGRVSQAGFSLMELMIALAIISILAAIAIPSYQRAVIRSNQTEAQNFLIELAQRQDQYLLDRRRYANTLETLGIDKPERVAKYYEIEMQVTAGPPLAYTIRSKPKDGTMQKGEEVLSITNLGEKTPPDLW